jgi:hypothetical protein
MIRPDRLDDAREQVAPGSIITGILMRRRAVQYRNQVGVRSVKLQKKAELLGEKAFLGVPVQDFEKGGREHFIYLLAAGLNPGSKIVDLGCGVLRAGYWLIHFLDSDCYCGIEPHPQRLAMGIDVILEQDVLTSKRPQFHDNPLFDTSVFGQKFDFFLAYSIWTHASKKQIRSMLDSFLRDSSEDARFLTSYLPASEEHPDYQSDSWYGTSHESDVPGCIYHSLSWIEAECDRRGLVTRELGKDKTYGQFWLEIERCGAPDGQRREGARFLHEYFPSHHDGARWPWSAASDPAEMRRELEARLAETNDSLTTKASECDGMRRALNDASAQLANLKRSRLLKVGRLLRRIAGLPIPY